jgi:hypothetical protein
VHANETSLLDNARALVSLGLRDAGYTYFNIDGGWEGGRNASGWVYPNTTRFPNGLEPVAAGVHALGLKFGMYTDKGASGKGEENWDERHRARRTLWCGTLPLLGCDRKSLRPCSLSLAANSGPGTCDGLTGSYPYYDNDAAYYAHLKADYVKVRARRQQMARVSRGCRHCLSAVLPPDTVRPRPSPPASPAQVDSCGGTQDHDGALALYAQFQAALVGAYTAAGLPPLYYSMCGCVRG